MKVIKVGKILLLLAIVLLIGRCSDNDIKEENKDAIDVSISVDEGYEISAENEIEATFKNTFTSTDSTVATLREGKYILGLRAGKTQIVVASDKKKTVYDVTVSAGNNKETRLVNSAETENDIKIGYGYNAMNGEELNQYSLTKAIFDWSKILKSGELIMDDTKVVDTKIFNGSTMNEFLDSYSEKKNVEIGVKLFGIKVYGKRKEFSELNVDQTKNLIDINQVYCQIQNKAYYFPEDNEGYASYVLPEVWEKLMGTDAKKTTVEEFIREYGTHVLTSGIYGGSFEWNYTLSDSDKCVLNMELDSDDKWVTDRPYTGCSYLHSYLEVSEVDYILSLESWERKNYRSTNVDQIYSDLEGYILKHPRELSRAMLEGEAKWFYDDNQYIDHLKMGKHDRNTSTKFIGDDPWFANSSVSGQTFDETLYDYATWKEWLRDGVLIGPKDQFSLYPVWDLIPSDTIEGKARREEFKKFIEKIRKTKEG